MDAKEHDELELDRLVDGELSPDDYRRTLARLDDEPGGWRQCALAFLEAQAWRHDLGFIRQEAEAPPAPHVAPVRHWPRVLTGVLALAACFMVAFMLGAYITGPLPSPFGGARPGVAVNPPSPPTASSPAEQRSGPALAATNPAPGRTPAGHVSFVVRGANGQPQQLEVPVYSQADGRAILSDQSSAIPPEVLAALERMGNNVRRQQQLLPVQLEDGRRVLVPVEQLEIVPVGGGSFQ